MLCLLALGAWFALSTPAGAQNQAELHYLRREIARHPDNVRAHTEYQDLMVSVGRRDEVLAAYQKRLDSDPEDAISIYLYGRLLSDDSERLSYYERAYSKDRDVFEICIDLGRAYYHAGDYDEAISLYKRAARIRDTSALTRNLLGLAYYHKGYVDLAVAEYKQAIERRPEYIDPRLNLGLTYYYTGRLDLAIDTYRRALELPDAGPERGRIYRNLGMAYARQGDESGAEEAYRRALDEAPGSADVYISLGNLAFNRRDYVEAARAYAEAASHGADTAGLHLKLGLSYFNTSRYGEAVDHLSRSLQLDPTQSDAHYYLGLAYLNDGEDRKAQGALQTYVAQEKRLSKNAVVFRAKQLLDDINRKLIRDMY